MNPFESARAAAISLRSELEAKGVSFELRAHAIVDAACEKLDIVLRPVSPDFPLLKGADATINVQRRWLFVRNDASEDLKAFLIAHELGHLRLHPATPDTFEVNEGSLTSDVKSNGEWEVESYGARERQELQANVFAREFLLPRDLARQLFIADRRSASEIAEKFALPSELVRLQLYDAILLPNVDRPAKTFRLPNKPTDAQRPAVESVAEVSLVEAGPGTGKTTTLLLRLRYLIESGVDPQRIVILTFSNKAARELVERAQAGNIPGVDRVWIGTFHSFGLEFLRKFGASLGLDASFPVLDKLATLAMMEADVPSVDLEAFDPLSNPSPWLESVIDTIRRAKDEVFDSQRFAAATQEAPSGDVEVDAKRRDVATLFQRYELLLSRRKAVDLADLLCLPIRLLQQNNPDIERFVAGIHHLMIDEYQDVNRASALLVKELARSTHSLWVVGDANQAIYAFMGASSSNLESFQIDFPGAVSIPLPCNHRSSQEIVDAFGIVASRNPEGWATLTLHAERGQIGHGPNYVQTVHRIEQLQALAWRIRRLETEGVPLAEQAVIVFKNVHAAELAAGLEDLGIPVLYLGNIFERPEIKDLICLLQLAIDPYGINLVRSWHSSLLALSRTGADLIFEQCRLQEKGWRDVSGEGLSSQDAFAWQNLCRLCSLIDENQAPWDAISTLLLEDGAWVRMLSELSGQAAANALMAVWQFAHFCRTPDGTGRWSTVRGLPERIRDRVRLGEDRSLRAVPPEAEGMNAIRILTAHGSKGLEFDAVHLLGCTKNTYETPKPQPNKLLPDAVRDSGTALDILKNERHNLLYVAVSRPRFHLTIHSISDEDLPSALNGLLYPLEVEEVRLNSAMMDSDLPHPDPVSVSTDDYLKYVKCPHRFEMSVRSGRSQREELKTYRAIELATNRAMRDLALDSSLMVEAKLTNVIDSALAKFSLQEHPSATTIRARVEERVRHGRDLLLQGGLNTEKINMQLGPLTVELQPDQIFQDGDSRRLRFIRPNESSRNAMKQPLAALLDAHQKAGGIKTTIEVATLSDGETASVGTVRAPTPERYREIAVNLCSKHFPANPADGDRTCHFCTYMFPCSKRSSE